eukprot:6211354-Pleurochrysis_carterae.AAC.1
MKGIFMHATRLANRSGWKPVRSRLQISEGPHSSSQDRGCQFGEAGVRDCDHRADERLKRKERVALACEQHLREQHLRARCTSHSHGFSTPFAGLMRRARRWLLKLALVRERDRRSDQQCFPDTCQMFRGHAQTLCEMGEVCTRQLYAWRA